MGEEEGEEPPLGAQGREDAVPPRHAFHYPPPLPPQLTGAYGQYYAASEFFLVCVSVLWCRRSRVSCSDAAVSGHSHPFDLEDVRMCSACDKQKQVTVIKLMRGL